MKIPKTISVCGIEHRIVFASPKRMKKEGGVVCYGCVDRDKSVIYLDRELKKNPGLLLDTLIHEVVGHALWNASGIEYWLQRMTKRDGNRFYEFQEIFIRWHTPALITTLRALGFLKETK